MWLIFDTLLGEGTFTNVLLWFYTKYQVVQVDPAQIWFATISQNDKKKKAT